VASWPTAAIGRQHAILEFDVAVPGPAGENWGRLAVMSKELSRLDSSGRRSARRYPLNADVEVLEPFNAHGVVINASQGGLRVAIDVELPIDTVCVVEVQLEEGKTVELARVAWVKAHPDGYLIGLSFVSED
jgi:hypothetical protein